MAATRTHLLRTFALFACLPVAAAYAGDRLPATGGLMQLEGSAGGGLTPWALIAGLGTDRQTGFSAMCTRMEPADFDLTSCGAAVGFRDRVEVSFARQDFALGSTAPGESIRQDTFGLKVRVLGDAVYDQDRWWPQVAVGAQHKVNRDFDLIPALLGAEDDSAIDWYLALTKLYLHGPLGRQWLVGVTLRATRANQLGLLGFGGDRNSAYRLQPEGTVGVFVTDSLVVGGEYRAKPNNLSVFDEDDAWDAFASWIPTRHWSVTGAYVDLGTIADKADQRGWYLSVQFSH